MCFAGVAEWQTRRLQVPVVARLCGFKSHLLHDGRIVKCLNYSIWRFFDVETKKHPLDIFVVCLATKKPP